MVEVFEAEDISSQIKFYKKKTLQIHAAYSTI